MEREEDSKRVANLVLELRPKRRMGKQEKVAVSSSHPHILRVIRFLGGISGPFLNYIERVLKEADAKSVSVDLIWLVEFLNSKVEALEANENEKQVPFLGGPFPGHLSFTREDYDKLNQLRTEIIEDITPLVVSDSTSRPVDQLVKLVQKINGVSLKLIWHVEPTEGDWRLVAGAKLITRGHRSSDMGYGKGVLKIGSEKWTVRHAFDDSYPQEFKKEGLAYFLRKAYYAVIITTLENGTFARLRRCQECRRFFVAERLGVKYCTDVCMKVADRRKAAELRMPKLRKRQRKEKEQMARQAAERRGFRRFSEFLKLAAKNHHTDEELSKLRPILKALSKRESFRGWSLIQPWEKQLKMGVSLKHLWESLPKQVKQIFETA